METPREILDRAIEEHSPSHVFVLVSGGGDSSLTANITFRYLDLIRYPGPRSVISLNTLLFADGWDEFLADYVRTAGWDHDPKRLFYTNPDPGFYEQWVMRFGFPYTRRTHLMMQNRLKLRGVEQLVREHKTHYYDRIMLVTGFRKLESHNRMVSTQPIQRNGGQVWVNPIFYYRDVDAALELANLDLPDNPYKRLWGVSGDCACGAFARPGELDRVASAFPCLGRRLKKLQDKVVGRYGWGWDERPPPEIRALLNTKAQMKKKIKEGQTVLGAEYFSPLCAGCKAIKPRYGESVEKRLLQELDW